MTGSTTMLRWLAALLVVVLVVIVGLLAWFVLSTSPGQGGDTVVDLPPASEEPMVTAPSGAIYFRAYDAESKRTYPLAYNFETTSYENVPHDTDKYYFDFYPDAEFSSALQGIYTERSNGDNRLPYSGFPQLVTPSTTTDLYIFDSGNLQRYADTEFFAFHGLSDTYTYENDASVYLAPENYGNIMNWSVYIHVPGEEYVREIRGAVDPVWAPDGQSIYYLGTDGVYRYELGSELVSQVARLAEGRFPTPVSSLEVSADAKQMYVLLSTNTLENDELHRFALRSPNQAVLIDTASLPTGERFMHLTIAPDNAYAAVTSRRLGGFDMYVFDVRGEEIELAPFFSWELPEGAFQFVHPKWFSQIQ